MNEPAVRSTAEKLAHLLIALWRKAYPAAFSVSGQRAEAEKVVTELQETAKRRYVSPYDVAALTAGLGEKEQAQGWLEKGYEDRSGWLWLWLKVNPKFDSLRADHRFHDLLRRVGHIP